MVSPHEANDYLQTYRSWLTDDGWSVKAVNDSQNHQNFHFTKDGEPSYSLVHPNPNAEFALVGIGLPGKEFTEILTNQSEDEREEFLWDLRISLLEFGIEFNGVKVPTEGITMSIPTYFEGTTRDSFMARVRTLKNSVHLFKWKINAAFELDDGDLGSQEERSYIQ